MPFTFAHPAIILPLNRLTNNWFSLTGLIIGAMVPDFEYFIRMHIRSIYSHTVWGLFWFDMPLAILLSFMFHNITRDLLFSNLPAFLNHRLSIYKTFSWNSYFKSHWPIVVFSVFIGACSHLFLDDFTHPQGYFVKLMPGVFNRAGIGTIPLYKLLQHTFTVISFVYIIYYLLKMPVNAAATKSALKYWLRVITSSIIIVGLRFLFAPNYQLIANIVVSVISAFLLSLIIIPLLLSNPKKQPGHSNR